MNILDNNTGELFVQQAEQGKKYITVGGEEYAPAIAIVFPNEQTSVNIGDTNLNANAFAAVPQLLEVWKFASEIANIQRGQDSDPKAFTRLMEMKIEELRKLTDKAKNKLNI